MTTVTEVFEGTFEADAIHASLEAGTSAAPVFDPRTGFERQVA